jgi:hypothetical protein
MSIWIWLLLFYLNTYTLADSINNYRRCRRTRHLFFAIMSFVGAVASLMAAGAGS